MHTPAGDPGFPTIRSWRNEVMVISREVGAFLVGSEDVFLDTGARVTELQQRTRAILQGARAATALESDAEPDQPAVRLDRELVRMDEYLRTARESSLAGARCLSQLLAQVESVLRNHTQLESIPPTLRMLALNTRIENARSGARNTGMEAVAAEVRRLGDLVEPRFRGVFSQASSLLETAHAAQATAEAFLRREGAWSTEMLGETRGALESLHALGRAQAAVASRAVAASEDLARELAAVLVALQGHDATRQVLEHVQQALDAYEAEAAAAEQAGQTDVGPWLARLAELCRVLSAQVDGARQRFTTALEAISQHLGALSRCGIELSQAAARCVASGSDASPAERVACGVERATRTLREHLAHEEASARAMRRVADTVQAIGTSVRDIQGIGAAVRIIALNALVETERAGQGGRVLAVLAQGMAALAAEVVEHTGEVSRLLNEVSDLAVSLGEASSEGQRSLGAAIASSLEKLARCLSEARQHLQAAVEDLHAGSRGLSDEIEGIAGRVSRQLAGARRLQEIAGRLERVGRETARRADPQLGPGDAASRSAVWSRYTMQSERTIHDRALSGARPARADAGGASADLGGNVELF